MAKGGSGSAKSSTARERELDAVMPKGCATEWWRPGHRGIEEAGHASPLGIVQHAHGRNHGEPGAVRAARRVR